MYDNILPINEVVLLLEAACGHYNLTFSNQISTAISTHLDSSQPLPSFLLAFPSPWDCLQQSVLQLQDVRTWDVSLSNRSVSYSLNRSKGVLPEHPYSFSILMIILFRKNEEKQAKKSTPWSCGLRHLDMHLFNKNSLLHILTHITALYMRVQQAKKKGKLH